MRYQRKVIILSSILTILVIVYAASWIFSPERSELRQSRFALLSEKDSQTVSKIEISRQLETTILAKINNAWTVEKDGLSYPAKSLRVDDLLKNLGQKNSYPKVASSAKAHAELDLTTETADRIRLFTGTDISCDLLLGKNDAEGNGRFIRLASSDAVYLGRDTLSYLIADGTRAWYNLALFPDSFKPEMIQRLSVEADISLDVGTQTSINFTLLRGTAQAWSFQHDQSLELDGGKVDSLLRAFTTVAGEDFLGLADPTDTNAEATIIAEDGNGKTWIMRLNKVLDSDKIEAWVSNQPYRYLFSLWNTKRLLVSELELLETID